LALGTLVHHGHLSVFDRLTYTCVRHITEVIAVDVTTDAEHKRADTLCVSLLHRSHHVVARACHVCIIAEVGLAISHEHDVLGIGASHKRV
jgi:hypothetical protein